MKPLTTICVVLLVAHCSSETSPPGVDLSDDAPVEDTLVADALSAEGVDADDPSDGMDDDTTDSQVSDETQADEWEDAGPDVQETEVELCTDLDGDGFRGSIGCDPQAEDHDCDEQEADVNPMAPEECNGRDDDCDGLTDAQDEDMVTIPCALKTGVCEGLNARCEEGSFQSCRADDYAAWASAHGTTYGGEQDNPALCDNWTTTRWAFAPWASRNALQGASGFSLMP